MARSIEASMGNPEEAAKKIDEMWGSVGKHLNS